MAITIKNCARFSLRLCAFARGFSAILFGIACCSPASAKDPLAKCELQSIASAPTSSMPYLVGEFLMQPAAENTPTYRKGPAGDWLVPEKVDPKDSDIRGLLMTPGGPLLMQIEVNIDGQPFRGITEQWIDAALKSKPAGDSPKPIPAAVNKEVVAVDAPSLQRFQSSSPLEWLSEYVKSAPAAVDRFEARWLLAQRSGGPALVELQRFSTNRSTAAPLVQFLDLDGDGKLAAAEIRQAESRLATSDFNQDGSVDLAELDRARPPKASTYRVWRAEPLFVVLDEHTDWTSLAQRYQPDAQAKASTQLPDNAPALDAASLKARASQAPDLLLHVRFGKDKSATGVELIGFSSAAAAAKDKIRTAAGAIAAGLNCGDVELSAGQPAEAANAAQVSVGAVVEGFPLWNLVDADGDGRLSIRERSQVTALLTGLDQNGDGALVGNEIPTRIRFAVALGANVHSLLMQKTPPIPRAAPAPREKAPDWFASMDANNDGDLTIGEFVGTREQFNALDANGDGLIGTQEAAKAP